MKFWTFFSGFGPTTNSNTSRLNFCLNVKQSSFFQNYIITIFGYFHLLNMIFEVEIYNFRDDFSDISAKT